MARKDRRFQVEFWGNSATAALQIAKFDISILISRCLAFPRDVGHISSQINVLLLKRLQLYPFNLRASATVSPPQNDHHV
ncbi:hypothetical protein Fmac_018537 [Flemingia macrophylla]|uniref:Uncharacterized protein n=1 Tax=Flemingia macrophylla TaxID=520843 RepID=A0ABD1M599_9FABA